MLSLPTRQEVTQALVDWNTDDAKAPDRLMPLV